MLPLLLFCIILALLNGCAKPQLPVGISDENLYYLKGTSGAVEMHFLSSGSTDLTLDQWNAISEGMVAMPLSAFGDFNTEISKLCGEVVCDYQVLQTIAELYAKMVNAKNKQPTK